MAGSAKVNRRIFLTPPNFSRYLAALKVVTDNPPQRSLVQIWYGVAMHDLKKLSLDFK